MKFDQQMLRLYAVTDRRWLSGRSLEDVVEEALAAGITMVQLREKHMDPEQFLKEACSLRVLCHRYHVPLLIDDSPEICLRSGADGVHVGQDDMSVQKARALLGPDKIIGATAHNVAEALMAERLGADYLGCGAAFGSHTKENARPIDRHIAISLLRFTFQSVRLAESQKRTLGNFVTWVCPASQSSPVSLLPIRSGHHAESCSGSAAACNKYGDRKETS
jgi:thiamine-phosphate diphosphorylase